MGDHEDSDMYLEKPRLLSSVNYGAILQAFVIVASVAGLAGMMQAQQSHMLKSMEDMQTQLKESLSVEMKLVNSRVDLVRAQLEGQIKANEARIDNQERLLMGDINRIRQMLEDLTDRLDRRDAREGKPK